MCDSHSGNRSSKTFKPKKNIPEGSHQYELLKHAEATLGSGNLRMAVMLPEGEDLNEWVAVNSKHLFFFSLDTPFYFRFRFLAKGAQHTSEKHLISSSLVPDS